MNVSADILNTIKYLGVTSDLDDMGETKTLLRMRCTGVKLEIVGLEDFLRHTRKLMN